VTILATNGLGIHHISILGIPAILIVASLVTRKKTMIFLTLYSVGCIAWLVFGEIYGWFIPEVFDRSVMGDFFSASVVVIMTAVMVGFITDALSHSNLQLHVELHERKLAEERLAFDALHDSLTGLPNRTLFMDRLGQKLEHVKRDPAATFAILYLDLDRFKVVNDSLGHSVGDQVLIATARRLTECVRADDTVSRLSGDEFAILLSDIKDSSDTVRLAYRVQEVLMSRSMLESIDRASTASIGIAIYNSNYTQPQEMLRDADTAMYRAKAHGGGRYQIFDASMYASALALLEMEAELKQAVENEEWEVDYQPVISLADRSVHGIEALVRWRHPKRGRINPGDFISVAEETGLILPIGEYVLRHACKQVRILREQGHPNMWVSVNISARQFQDQNLPRKIERILDETGLPGNGLQLELTETVAMKDLSYSVRVLKELERMGISVSLDDFGNGYSSFGYLNRFPIKVLKIDRSFIHSMDQKKNNKAIIEAIISMGHTLNLVVVAEGVETKKQLAFLDSIGCDEGQGFLFSRPVAADKLVSRVEAFEAR
jgi:diguanylate cyclase (GGDEF)-like protein